jgi:CHAT domain-containing protein
MDTSSLWSKWQFSLPELPGTYEEIDLLRKRYGAKTFKKGKSTEKRFKSYSEDYKILHLAMHTLLDQDSPERSFLAFTPLADKAEDGKLFANEIRNLGLNSSLTILSACNSGTGELAAGEGVLSLSRMFLLGGSSSVIMTLWSVDDRASKELIGKFYEDIAYDLTVSEALRSSKMDFLRNADKLESHPYFWAGFIQLGKDTSIDIDKNLFRWPYVVSALFVIFLFLTGLFYIKTKSRR